MKIEIFQINQHKESKIILYGTPDYQYMITNYLNKFNLKIYRYVNGKYAGKTPFSNTISCEELSKLVRQDRNTVIIFAVYNQIGMELKNLQKYGIEQIYSTRELLKKSDFKDVIFDENKIHKFIYDNRAASEFFEDVYRFPYKKFVKSVDAVVTECCSLRCEGCSNLMQYYKKPKNLDVERLCDSLDLFLKKIDELLGLRILGGEPFVNSNFVKLIERFQNNSKVKRIEIFSNATIFPNNRVLEYLKKTKVYLIFSDYDELSTQLNTWIQWCEENSVMYSVMKMDRWQDCGKLERHEYNKYQLIDIYANCVCRNVPTIIENHLYNCAYAANAANLGAMYKEDMLKDSLELTDTLTSEEVMKFLHERPYLEACRYCNGRNSKRASILPHIQTSKPLVYKELYMKNKESDYSDVQCYTSECTELLSVIVPIYNSEKYIEKCLKTLLLQSYRYLDIILIDDGSIDKSVEICKKLIKKYSCGEKVTLIENTHKGVVYTRNIGIKSARGKKIAFVDSDDFLELNYFESLMNQMGNADLLCSGNMIYDEEKIISDNSMDKGQGKVSIEKFRLEARTYNETEKNRILFEPIAHSKFRYTLWGKIFKTEIIRLVNSLVNDTIWMGEDRLLVELYMLKAKEVNFVEEYGYYYRKNLIRNKYPWKKCIQNAELIKQIQLDAIKGNPNEKQFLNRIENEYLSFVKFGLTMLTEYREYYYPYYGRLKGKKIILYGAGKVGISYYYTILSDAESTLVAWVDKNAENIQNDKGLPVEKLENLKNYSYDNLIIAVFEEELFERIKNELIQNGIEENQILWNDTKLVM